MVLIALAGLIALVATLWAMRHQDVPVRDPSTDAQTTQSVTRAEGLATLPHDYDGWRPIPKLGSPTGELGRPVLRAEQDAGIDAFGSGSLRPNPEVDAQRVARLRLQDEAEAAAKAQVFFQTRHSVGQPAVRDPRNDEPSDGDPMVFNSNVPTSKSIGEDENVDQQRKLGFIKAKGDPTIYASGKLQEPASPYQLMAGTVVAAAFFTGINSDLPGQAIATVTQNVFDTVTGNYLLIPQGSRLIGQYDSQVSFGQRRVLLVWTRLIMPDGSSVTLDRLQGADASGNTGIGDRVDWHWDRVFAGAAVSTLLGINAELAAPDRGLNSGSLVIASRQSAQDTINQVGQQLTRRNLNVQQTLSIRPGFPLRVIINKDLILTPYSIASERKSKP
jgi:type IV secretion system protein VirB10